MAVSGRVDFRRRRNRGLRRSTLPTLVVGLGFFLGFPTTAAFQDMTSLVSGAETAFGNTFVEKAGAGSVQAAEMPFRDSLVTGSISGAGRAMPGIGVVAFRTKAASVDAEPDENRVNRAEKRGRVINVSPVLPPRQFNAGSILQRT